MPLGRLEAMGVSLSVARMSRASAPKTKAMGESAKVASVEAPSSWVRTCWRRVRVSTVRAVLMEEKALAVALVAAEEADAAAGDWAGRSSRRRRCSARGGWRWSGWGAVAAGLVEHVADEEGAVGVGEDAVGFGAGGLVMDVGGDVDGAGEGGRGGDVAGGAEGVGGEELAPLRHCRGRRERRWRRYPGRRRGR